MLRKNQPKDLLRNIKTPTACGGSTKTPKILKGTNPGTLTIKGGSLVDTSMRMNTQRQVVEIKVGYTYSRIVTPKEAIAVAAKEFSAFARNAQYQTLYQRGLWDGRYSMVNKKDGSFGTGMLADIKAYLEHEIGATIELTDLREVPPSSYSFEWLFDKPLREAQVGALEKLNSNTGGIIRMVTGSGKTNAFSKLIQERGVRTLVCVPSKELLYQTAEVLNSNIGGKDFKLGLLGDGHWPDERSTVVVAMYQSLVSLHGKTPEERAQFIETMGSFDMLICDECHKVCSNDSITKTWETIMDINTYYRYGFSATPFEKKGTVAEMLQRSAFGKIIYDMNMTEAREAGYVTPFTVYMLKPEYPRELTRQGTTGMTWNEAHDYYIGNNATRNDAVVQAVGLLLRDNRKVMVVAQRIQHNELLAKMFAETYGEDNVYLLHGQLDSTYRKKSMGEFKARKTPCIMVASSVGNDGIDIPDIDGLVLAHGGKSFFQNVQRTGRGLRSAQGKKDLVFIDFNDAALGRWFQNHTKKRVEYYQDLGAKVVFA